MEILNLIKLIVILLLLILFGCGQQTMKDEGLESKDINSVSSSGSNAEFKVTSVDPADGETSVSTTNISFTFNKSLTSYGAGNSNDCNQQLFYLSTDSNFSTCVGWNSSCSGFSSYTRISGDGKTLTLCTTSLNSSTIYYLKVVSSGNGIELAADGTSFTEFESSFTTQ